MWNFDYPVDGDLGNLEIVPEHVLYEYDGPLIFSAKFGLSHLLFTKVAAKFGHDYYLCCDTNRNEVEALKDGRLSVFGAFDSETYWILALDSTFRVSKYWSCEKGIIPKRYFAKPGLGLFPTFGLVPDTLAQANSIISVKYKGEKLTDNGIPLGKLKAIIDSTSELIRKLLTPIELLNTQSSTFDFEISPLKFSSLVISVKEPIMNMSAIQRVKTMKGITNLNVRNQVRKRGEEFSERLSRIHQAGNEKKYNSEFVSENFEILNIISEVLPKESGYLDSVEFNTFGTLGVSTVVFDKENASYIHSALAKTGTSRVRIKGKIVGFTGKSCSLKLQTEYGREVKCVLDPQRFEDVVSKKTTLYQQHVEVTGEMTRRKRIDVLEVDSYHFTDIFQ